MYDSDNTEIEILSQVYVYDTDLDIWLPQRAETDTPTPVATKAKTIVSPAARSFSSKWAGYGLYHHKEAAPAFTLDGVDFYATGREGFPFLHLHRLHREGQKTLVISCGAGPPPATDFPIISAPPSFGASPEHESPPFYDVLELAWTDYWYPRLTLDFWTYLVAYIKEHAYDNVAVYCGAGIGRTGTALSAICICYGLHWEDAIDFVRDNHADGAVETAEQETYLRELVAK